MSRIRVGSVKASAAENEQMTHLWHSLVDTLRLLPSLPTNPSVLKSSSVSDQDRARDVRTLQNERRTLDDALEKLGILIALRRGSSVPPDVGAGGGAGAGAVPSLNVSTPTPTPAPASAPGTGSGAGGIKRKRKSSFGHGSASPAPSLLQPNSREKDDPHHHNHHHHQSASASASPGPPGSGSGYRQSTPMSREATGKHRRELYYDQLPLQPGRRVAFKPARQKANEDDPATGLGGTGGDDWIMATVKRCIQQDKMRYEVEDVDDDDHTTYNTTLRSIIPLPDPNSPAHLSSNPLNLEDFPRDAQVLALYPDTTSFYRATVITAPLPGTGNGLGLRSGTAGPGAKKGVYQLMFVDDDNKVHQVHKDFVLAYPF